MNEPPTRPLPACAPPAPPALRAPVQRRHGGLRRLAALASLATLGFAVAAPAAAADEGSIDPAVLGEIRALGDAAGATLAGRPVRVEVEPGRLDPRLRLAPCHKVEASLPRGATAWGRTRVVLSCVDGPTPWKVYLPVTVKVFADAWVAASPLPAGTVLQSEHLQPAEVDWAAERSPPVVDEQHLLGRTLVHALPPGEPVRAADLAQRRWFGAGDRVQVLARGAGFSVSGEARALGAGVDGRPVRVRTETGQVLTGMPVGVNRVEVPM